MTWKTDFDFQWGHIPSPAITYTHDRVKELLKISKLPRRFFKNKKCLDAGCGNGRYTYAMQELGAEVISFDISLKAIELCRKVNPDAYIFDLNDLEANPIYDFVLCWGVLNHIPDPKIGFKKIASQVKPNGTLFIMVYHEDTQEMFIELRKLWRTLNQANRLKMCRFMIKKHGGNLHGWWDAFNPQYNWGFRPEQIKSWFITEGFSNIRLTQRYNINMRARAR